MDIKSAYRTLLAASFVAGAFSLFIAINLTVNQLRLERSDPLNSLALEKLRNDLRMQAQNESLKTEIRELDLLARKAYFSSLTFSNAGAWLLLGSLIISLAALKSAASISRRGPRPGKYEAKDESLEFASQARESLAATLAIMAIVAGFVWLVSDRPIDFSAAPDEPARPSGDQREKLAAMMRLNWPAFRGHNGIGIAHYSNAPVSWNGKTGENVVWKKPVPRRGFSSPIVWGNRVFLTCSDETAREVLCYDGGSGELLWRREVGVVAGMPPELPEVSEDTTYAAATPATDGRFVFAIFGTGNIVCFDFEGGKQWARHLVDVDNIYGHASSLITYRDMLFVQFDDSTEGRVFALDSATGETVWLARRDLEPCWSSPIIAESGSESQLVVAGNPFLTGYDPASGEKLWEYECLGGEVASSPAFADGMVFCANEYAALTALKLADPIELAWEAFDELPDVSSPLATDERLFVASGYGVLNCYDSASGKLLWTREFDEGFYSSPILVGDLVYLMDRAGVMHIFRDAGEYDQIAACELGEAATSIPAVMDGKIYIRGVRSLFCIGEH